MSDRKPKYVAEQIHLTETDLYVDGVRLPWWVGEDIEVIMDRAPHLYGLQIEILANRIIVQNKDASHPPFDTRMVEVRSEALAIVREGLADIIAQLSERSAT